MGRIRNINGHAQETRTSFSLKLVIWDVAAAAGVENISAVYKEAEHRLRKLQGNGELVGEELPTERTVRRIITVDLHRLPQEVVLAKLPRHIWLLRKDCEAIRRLEKETIKRERNHTGTGPEATRHLNQLAKTAEVLAHQCERMLRYKDDARVKLIGDVISGLTFWWRSNMQLVGEGFETDESEYERRHPIDEYLARLLLIHYKGQFGKQSLVDWKQLSLDNVNRELLENLNLLAHGGLKPCTDCPVCGQATPQPDFENLAG